MQQALIINSIVCAIGAIVGLLFAGASIISIANMNVPWSGLLLVAAVLLPVTFLISGVGAWLANARGYSQLVTALIATPWVYSLGFVVVMLLSFKR
jgi:hypothetical protein